MLFRLRQASQGLSFLLLVFDESPEAALLILLESLDSVAPVLGLMSRSLEVIAMGAVRAIEVGMFMV